MNRLQRITFGGFIVGALVPGFWGVLGFLLFNVPEGGFSHVFWNAVYLTCPFWSIGGEKALILMPLLNGCMYATIAAFLFTLGKRFASKRQETASLEGMPRRK